MPRAKLKSKISVSPTKEIELARKNSTVSFAIDQSFHEALKIEAPRHGEKVSSVLQKFVKDYLNRNNWSITKY